MHEINVCKVLHINLLEKKYEVEVFDREMLEKFLGGRGISSYLLYRDLSKAIDPLGSENIVIFAPGVLCGTDAPTAGRTTITTKSPATGLFVKSNMGGDWGPEFKFTGYDILVLHDYADEWTHVIISNNEIYFESATQYMGKSVVDTTEAIIADHPKMPNLAVACIGQAGENFVKYAGVFCSAYSAAARGGIGAVMASKKVKAISCYGRDGIKVKKTEEFLGLTEKSRQKIESVDRCAMYKKYGTAGNISGLNEAYQLPVRNFQKGHLDNVYDITGQALIDKGHLLRIESCYSCTISCKRYTKTIKNYPGSESGGPEYENISVIGAGCEVLDTDACLRANDLCNQFGLDIISTGTCIQWAMECAEREVLPKKFADPLTGQKFNLAFGDSKGMLALIEMIAFRRGLGDLLADGVRHAANVVGKDSWKWAIEAKGLEQSRVETRNAKGYALAFAVNPRGPDHLYGQCMAEFGLSQEMLSIIKRITGDEKYAVSESVEKKPEIVEWHENVYAITDILGICSRASLSTYSVLPEDMTRFFEAATGISMTDEKMMEAARRVINLERSFNMREGVRRESDRLPWRLMHEPLGSSIKDKFSMNSPEELDGMLDKYYKLRGWDTNGLPLWETIKELGLDILISEDDFLL